jgi:hypothetical protein
VEAPELPTRIGRFAVLHALGAGGMGLVCAAYDAELDRKVAIKLLRPNKAALRGAARSGRPACCARPRRWRGWPTRTW